MKENNITDINRVGLYGLSYKDYCDIPLEDLRYLKVLHYGFDQNIYVGELMVATELADKFLYIFIVT